MYRGNLGPLIEADLGILVVAAANYDKRDYEQDGGYGAQFR